MSYSWPDVVISPGSGAVGQNLGDVIVGAPKGAADQIVNCIYTGHRVPGDSGSYNYTVLHNRFTGSDLEVTLTPV